MLTRLIVLTSVAMYVCWAQVTINPKVLTQDQVVQLEAQVAANPADVNSQAQLGYNYGYFVLGVTADGARGTAVSFDETKAESDFAQQHVTAQLETSTLPTLLGYAGYVLWAERSVIATLAASRGAPEAISSDGRKPNALQRRLDSAYLLGALATDRATEFAPLEITWHNQRMQIVFEGLQTGLSPLKPAQAYAVLKTDFTAMGHSYQLGWEPEMGELAVEIGAYSDAQAYAQDLLTTAQASPGSGYWVAYDGNMLMGEVAIRTGDIEAAKKYLLASTTGTGGGKLTPNMMLAKDLLIVGETATVIQFFQLCKNVWPSGADLLDAWTSQVQGGQMPRFDSYLGIF